MDVFNPPLGAGCPSLDDDGDTKISAIWGTPSQLKNGRKAKRALRRRMKPKQRRCCDRMTGPTLEQRSREVPKLPPGADGLAAVSLRPSLAKQGQYAGVRAPMATYPRRPATASNQRHQAGKPQLLRDSTYSGGRRIKSSSAPPTATGSRDANAGESTDHQDDYEVLPKAGLEIHCPSETQEPLQPSQMYPLRPTVEKERTPLSYADVGQRTLRRSETSTPTVEGNQEDDDQADYGRVVRCEEPRLDQGTTVVGQKGAYTAESELVTNPFFSTPQNAADYHPADGECQSAGGQDRGATVVLSSTVLLSPRGRARTPTPSTAFAVERRATSQDNEADWAYSLSPRPHKAQDSYFGGGSWHDPPPAYSSNARCEQRWAPSEAKSGQHGTSKDPAELLEILWGQGSVSVAHGRHELAHAKLARTLFGKDEFAGDREIACFLASAAAAAEAEAASSATAASLAAATAKFSAQETGETHSSQRSPLLLPKATISLVAVPIHADDPSRRYNPYHLRIVSREVDRGLGAGRRDDLKGMPDDDGETSGNSSNEDSFGEPLPRWQKASCPPQGNHRRRSAEQRGSPGTALGMEKKQGQGGCRDIERAYICSDGVTYVNVHGETTFQSLNQWSKEKERFDTLSRMRFVRSYPAWKYIRAITTFIGRKRVNQLKDGVERGLITLDAVYSSAIQEIVVQLERVQSLCFVTAKKGATAAYTLDEFFHEQARNTVKCEREVMDVYDRCGQILGRMAKKHLEAEGLLVMNRAWNQASAAHRGNMPSVHLPRDGGSPNKESTNTGVPSEDHASSVAIAARRSSLEQVLLSTVNQATSRKAGGDIDDDDDKCSAAEPPTSWSFAARQRYECARIARVFSFARHRIRQELRGLALDHGERLLGAVARRLVAVPEERGTRAANADGIVRGRAAAREQTQREQPSVGHSGFDSRGGEGGQRPEGTPMQRKQPRQFGVCDQEQEGQEDDEDDDDDDADVIRHQEVRTRRNLRHEARPYDSWNMRWALAVDEGDMADLSTLALRASLLEDATGDGSESGAEEGADLVVKWRKAFREAVTSTGGKRDSLAPSRFNFCSRISVQDNCLSVPRAIQLACELIPHATETLAIKNPLGAKPVLIETFEAEITPNLRGEEFFPITHRFSGEQKGVTEDVFLSAALKLSAACLGGIDAQLSEVSSNSSEEEDGEGEGLMVSRPAADEEKQREHARRPIYENKDHRNPTVLDASMWDANRNAGSLPGVRVAAPPPRTGTSMRPEHLSEIYGISTGPCGGISLKVDIRGNFEEWDLQVFPPLEDFVRRAKQSQVQVLTTLARVPCILEHPDVKPYQTMVEGYGLGFELPQVGDEDTASERENTSTSWEETGGRSIAETTDRMEQLAEGPMDECDWLENLSEDPYYRGLQDKVFLSLASSHNSVYRMVNGFRPLLQEFQALGTFTAERDREYEILQSTSDPDAIAADVIASAKRTGRKAGSLDLSPVLLAKPTTEWLHGWYSRFERFRQTVRATQIDSPQALLSINATDLIAYLVALPEKCLEDIRLIGPRLMLNATAILGAVFRRCNAILSGGLLGVDAIGEKAVFLCQVGQWLWQLRDEVQKLQDLGILLKKIGCFDAWSSPRVVAKTGSGVVPANGDGSSMPLSPPLVGTASKPAEKTAFSPTKTSRGEGNGKDATPTNDVAGSEQQTGPPPDDGDKNNDSRGPAGKVCGFFDDRGWYDFRAVENQTREATENVGYHLVVLQRSVDQAHINMRVASQEFSSLLRKALESLSRDIDRLEADILDPALSSASTDPTKACSRLEGYRQRLADLQEDESRYHHYSGFLDKDVVRTLAKGEAKNQLDKENMQLDLERVGAERRQLVLKWEAQRKAVHIRQEWESSALIFCDADVMASQLSRAVRAHAFAVETAGGADEVSASCEATLAHLGRVVGAVGFLHNRDLTAAYWERVEQAMPLREDLTRAARKEFMPALRHAAGLEKGPQADINDNNGESLNQAEPPSAEKGKNTAIEKTGVAASVDPAATDPTDSVTGPLSSGTAKVFSSVATRVIPPKFDAGGKLRVSKAAAVVSSVAGRERREDARRRAEVYEVFPMAAGWGGLSLSTLLDHGLLEKIKVIGSISAEATASAVLRKTLEELEGVWEAAPMIFLWRFNEGAPAPGITKQSPTVDSDSLRRRRLYSRVLAEPALVQQGYSTGTIAGGVSGGGSEGASDLPASEGFTSLLSNGDELLRLAEHCRLVVDSVVDAPSALLAVGNIGQAALEWQKRISWFQEILTNWMAVQEQWVRLAPAFVPEHLDDGVPAHDRVRFTDVSGSFQNILGTLRADTCMTVLAGKQQGVERGGRSLLAKVRKLQDDLEGVSVTMDRHDSHGQSKTNKWLSSRTAVCPRLLALPRHHLFRLFRDWAAGRVGSGAAAGETNERAACMFRGIGEILWKEVVSTSGTTVRTHVAAAGVRCCGAGLEAVPFSSPIPAVGRLEMWVRDFDRQLMSAIAEDVEIAANSLRQYQTGGGFGHLGLRTSDLNAIPGLLPRSGIPSLSNKPSNTATGERSGGDPYAVGGDGDGGKNGEQTTTGRQPSVQGQLLARGAQWTAQIESVLACTTISEPLHSTDGGNGGGGAAGVSAATNKPERNKLQDVLESLLLNLSAWSGEFSQPDGLTAYNSLTITALATQALQQRDVVEELLQTVLMPRPSPSLTPPSEIDGQGRQAGKTLATSAASGMPPSSPTAPSTPSSIKGHRDREHDIDEEKNYFPFLWACHLRHYYTSPEEAQSLNGRAQQSSDLQTDNDDRSDHSAAGGGGTKNAGRGGYEDQENDSVPPPPPPLVLVSVGPWNVPYGFEYAGTLERLWLTPLSERCLLHAVHSAKGLYGGLLVSASARRHRSRQFDETSGSFITMPPSPVDVSTVALDVATAFGRPFRQLHSGCVTSPQAVSSVIASTLMAGGVTVFAGVDELPKVSLAVLAESLRAVMLCMHAGQEKVLVNGEEVPLSTTPHLLPNFDPILHQWRLLPWGRQRAAGAGSCHNNNTGGGGGGPFLGFFATLARTGPAPQLPLSVRSAFRPVLTVLPNIPLILEAMLLSSGFVGARALVRGLVGGLRELQNIPAPCHTRSDGNAGNPHNMGKLSSETATAAEKSSSNSSNNRRSAGDDSVTRPADPATLLHAVAVKAVRTAAELLAPETARELRAARRKLGLASLTSSERKEKTKHLSRAVEARVLIAGFVRALLFEETGGDARALKSQKTKKPALSISGNTNSTSSASSASAPKIVPVDNLAATPTDAGQLEIDTRRAVMVSTFQKTQVLQEILKPLEDMAATGRKLAQQNLKLRATELAESGTAIRSRDVAKLKTLVKRALIMNGMSPTKDQIDAAAELWQALWSCSRPAVIMTGAAGIGKSSILQAMPKMAEHVDLINRKLNKSLKKQVPKAKKKQDGAEAGGATAQHPNASVLDPPGAVFEPPANSRGAAPYRRIVNRQVPFLVYVNATSTGCEGGNKSDDGGTVVSGASGSSKGTKATTISETSNVSGASSDGGASVFSQRSAATKSSSASGKSSAAGSGVARVGKSGSGGIPPATIEGSAFVVPAQEIEVLYTGGCSAEHLIGSTDDKGCWLDGLLVRRLRALVEGVRGGACTMAKRPRHRACGVGTGDVCLPPAGKATSGFSHGCRSRLLVLDGPISRVLEGILASDHAGGPPLTGPEECRHSSRCLLLPDGEALALDAWGHVAVETGDVRHLSPSTITGAVIVHLRADGPALVKGMREAWLKRLHRRRFQQPRSGGGVLSPVLLEVVSEFFRQKDFVEGGCCLKDTGDATSALCVDPYTPASTYASRMRNTLLLLERLLDVLVDTDEHAVVWEAEPASEENEPHPGTGAPAFKSLSTRWAKLSTGFGASHAFMQAVVPEDGMEKRATTSAVGLELDKSAGKQPGPSSFHARMNAPKAHDDAEVDGPTGTPARAQSLIVAHRNELTPAEIQEMKKRLRLRAFLLCVYASIWGMGGHLVGEASRVMCSAFVRQSSPLELRQHIRDNNLFDFVVDIEHTKLVPIGEDASACPGALPRGMWTLDPHWITQASELSCPLPPSLVIPSQRLSSVATAAYSLLGMDCARVLVQGPSGAGKTALLSHLLKVMGKGIPDLVARQPNNQPAKQMARDKAKTEGSTAGSPPATPQEINSAPPEAAPPMIAGSIGNKPPGTAFVGEQENGQRGLNQQRGAEKVGLDRRIHLLDSARRRMADAGTTIAAACAEAKAAAESGTTPPARIYNGATARQVNPGPSPAGQRDRHPGQAPFTSQHGGCTLPRSSVYLNMRRLATTADIAGVIGRALRREKDGVLEAPQDSSTVVFLDDVHFAEESPGEGRSDSPCGANSCPAETIRGMIDGYDALGEIRVSSTARRQAEKEQWGRDHGGLGGGEAGAAGLPRMCQVHPDFAPRAPSGPVGDSFSRPSTVAVLAARTSLNSPVSGSTSATPAYSLGSTTSGSGATLEPTAGAPARLSMMGSANGGPAGGGGPTVPSLLNPLDRNHEDGQQGRQPLGLSSHASSTDRLWTRFAILALDAPSTCELRSVFSRACSDAFAGEGSVCSAVKGPIGRFSAPTKTTMLITSEVWKAVDAMAGVTADFLQRLHQRLLEESSSSSKPSPLFLLSRGARQSSAGGADGQAAASRLGRLLDTGAVAGGGLGEAACRLDYFSLGRLLRPLVLGRSGNISTPAAVQRFFTHEIMREVVEPLRESSQRKLATFELARLIRERALDIGIDVHEERTILETWFPTGAETPPIWTNTRGLVMAVAYWEQQATKAITAQKTAGEKHVSKGSLAGPREHTGGNVSYLEVCSKGDEGAGNQSKTPPTGKRAEISQTIVAHGVLMNTKDVFSVGAITKYFARAVELLKVPWPARPDSKPIVTPQDVTNICKCLRQLSIPWNPLLVLRLESRGMSREGGPESAFRLASALEGTGMVVMDAGIGRMCAKTESGNGAGPPREASSRTFNAALRKAVLTCIGKTSQGPHLERSGDVGEDLWLNPGCCQSPDAAHGYSTGGGNDATTPTTSSCFTTTSRDGKAGLSSAHSPLIGMAGPLVPTKTVLLVRGKGTRHR
ncbi:unnamed protein product [Ectocarpus sp. 4 AP-2014]